MQPEQLGKGAQLLFVEAVLAHGSGNFLGQGADPQPARALKLTGAGDVFAAEDAQEAGFSGTIGAHQRDARILGNGAVHRGEEGFGAVLLGQVPRLVTGTSLKMLPKGWVEG